MLPEPPLAPTESHIREFFGDRFADPYAWMSDRDDPKLLAYLEAENAYARSLTAHLDPLAETIFDEIKGRVQETDLSVPVRYRGFWYYTRTLEGLQYPIEARVAVECHPGLPELTNGRAPAGEQILLDHNAEADGLDFFVVGSSAVSPDGTLLAYAADTQGDERYDLRIRDIASGRTLDREVCQAGEDIVWSLDGRHVFYVRHDESWRAYQVWRHEIGEPADRDVLVYQEDDAMFWVSLGSSRDDRFVLIAAGSKTSSEWHLLDAAAPTGPLQCICPRRPGIEYDVEVAADRLFVAHNTERVNFALAQAPLTATSSDQWTPLPVTDAEDHLTGVGAFDRFVVLSLRTNGLRGLRILPVDPAESTGFGPAHDIDLAEPLGSLGLDDNPDPSTASLRIRFSSLVTPGSHLDYDVATRATTLLKRQPVLGGFDPGDYVQWRDWATAADGTRVPISLVRQARLPRDGTAAGLLYGYGSYGHALEPDFRMTLRSLSLLDRGYVLALAHVRGGSELGRPWYDAGRLEHKVNTFTDFVACADQLRRSGWIDPDRLAAQGGSAGGLLMGVVVNEAPDRFAFVHAAVPFVDALTTILDETLPLTVSEWEEWGDAPHDERAYRLMRSYAPYDNVRRQRYPALLVTANLHDTRVFITEPAKWVAALRANAQVDPAVNPVIFRTELTPSSHLGQSGRYDQWRQDAWEDAVLIAYTGPGRRPPS